MNEPARILTAQAEHLADLSRIAIQGFFENFGHLYKPQALEQHLTKTCSVDFFAQALAGGDRILMAYAQDTPLGYVKAGKLGLPVEPFPADASELHRLYVLHPYQGDGLGKQLMDAAMRLPILQATREIYLGVWENNHRAQHFYASYGFTKVGEYDYHVGEHTDREWIMRRANL